MPACQRTSVPSTRAAANLLPQVLDVWSRAILFDSLRSHLSSFPCPTRPLHPSNLSWGGGLQATDGPEQVWRVLKTRPFRPAAVMYPLPRCNTTAVPRSVQQQQQQQQS